jgi:prepilin-type N-terminal cleavage/methylation domain-containing protein
LESGFTLVEVIVAAMILVIGLLSLAQLLAVSIRAESMARNGAEATRLAQGQLDALMKAGFGDPRLAAVGGPDPLTANVANHFANPKPGATVRWRVGTGPSNTKVLTVRVLMPVGTTAMRIVDLSTLLREW